MRIKYIDKDGNFAELETLLDTQWESKLEKVGRVYFEKKDIIENVKPKEEVKVDVIEPIQFDEVGAKEFLKQKGIRGYGLLKGEWLKKRALEEWFIIK